MGAPSSGLRVLDQSDSQSRPWRNVVNRRPLIGKDAGDSVAGATMNENMTIYPKMLVYKRGSVASHKQVSAALVEGLDVGVALGVEPKSRQCSLAQAGACGLSRRA